MDIQSRSYSGKFFLPKPTVEYDPALETMFIVTSWGDPAAAPFAIDILKERANSAVIENTEVTRIGKFVEPIVDEKGGLVKSMDTLNQLLNKRFNDIEYKTTVEVLALERKGNLISWVQVGAPSIFLFNGKSLSPVSHQISFATQFQQRSPMANAALGVFPSFNLCSGSFPLSKNDSILLLSRDSVPATIFNPQHKGLEKWTEVLANSDVDRPFWIATVSI